MCQGLPDLGVVDAPLTHTNTCLVDWNVFICHEKNRVSTPGYLVVWM